MKFLKCILAVLITLVLTFGLAVPAVLAQDVQVQSTVNWSDFYIITQPQPQTILYGESFTLSVEVNVPDGVVVEYQWRRSLFGGSESGSLRISDGTNSTLQRSHADSHYPARNDFLIYYCVITAYEKDANGEVISSRTLTSERARVTTYVERTFWDAIFGITIAPFIIAGALTMTGIVISFGLAIPLAPIMFLGTLIYGFILGFMDLFS